MPRLIDLSYDFAADIWQVGTFDVPLGAWYKGGFSDFASGERGGRVLMTPPMFLASQAENEARFIEAVAKAGHKISLPSNEITECKE